MEITEKVITGMTIGQLIIVVSSAIVAIAAALRIFMSILEKSLEPFKDLPKELSEIKGKIFSETELNRMIDNKILEHQLSCEKNRGGNK